MSIRELLVKAQVGRVQRGGRLPRAVAVAIKSSSEDMSYAAILRRARANFSLSELGVEAARIREVANGGLLIEIPGPEGRILRRTFWLVD